MIEVSEIVVRDYFVGCNSLCLIPHDTSAFVVTKGLAIDTEHKPALEISILFYFFDGCVKMGKNSCLYLWGKSIRKICRTNKFWRFWRARIWLPYCNGSYP